MGELASKGQLQMAFTRWALVCVPALVFLGFLSGRASGSGANSGWYRALTLPAIMPPGWAFGLVWSVLYVVLGLILASLINARGARGKRLAITLFLVQFLLNLGWSPLFFVAHQVSLALILILVMLIVAVAATFAIAQVRRNAARWMLPYLIWLGFASALNFEVDRLNPGAATRTPAPAASVSF